MPVTESTVALVTYCAVAVPESVPRTESVTALTVPELSDETMPLVRAESVAVGERLVRYVASNESASTRPEPVMVPLTVRRPTTRRVELVASEMPLERASDELTRTYELAGTTSCAEARGVTVHKSTATTANKRANE